MTLRERIEIAAQSNAVQQNTLTDGRFSITYQEMPALFEQIDIAIQAHGLQRGDCIAYECVNSVPGALTLLYLFAYNHSFVLLPPEANSTDDENGLDLKPVPRFCKFRLLVAPVKTVDKSQDSVLRPEHFLAVDVNPEHNGLNVQEAHGSPDGIVYLRTSGSMGTSKITVHTHSKLLTNALNCVERFGLVSNDRVAIPVPIFHMYGLGAGFLPAIAAYASIDLQEKSNILRYLDRERKFNPNVAYLIPTLCEMLLQGRKKPRPYKRVVTATQRIKEDTFHQFDAQFGGLVNLYGSTELGAIATSIPDDSVARRAVTIKPMSGVALRVESEYLAQQNDPTQFVEGESSLSGVLACQHASGFTGYVDEDGEWIQRLAPNDWYETGDIAQKNQDDTFQIVGRAKNSINRNGYLVLFADIERAMEKLNDIEQVVVVAATGETLQGERIAAFCLPDNDVHSNSYGTELFWRTIHSVDDKGAG